ncbi:MAG: glycosyltransferase [Solobacterium sp.]|nr:glycosyltransferase [Solobacterium sp.]
MFQIFSVIVAISLTVFYLYQFIYIVYAIFHRHVPKLPDAKVNHRYAIFISARNEESVIFELLDSLTKQDYPKECYDIYVVADNCTDHTAEVSAQHGAVVFERQDHEKVGKGYALNYIYGKVQELKGKGYYDAYFVFDADNLVDDQFLKEANKTFDTGKYDAFTSYRNSKNYDVNWITASYSLWFMHEARHLNYPRMCMGAQCMISGTGFCVSEKVMQENNGWPYYLLTEDIQFSVASTLNNLRIGYCDSAILYDEQPASMKQSWNQRLRWAKGFYQIDARYIGKLIKGIFTMPKRRLACYDVLMTVVPCSLLTVMTILICGYVLCSAWFMPYYVQMVFRQQIFVLLGLTLLNFYGGLIIVGGLTIIMENDRIHTTKWKKWKNLWLFPVFMLTYLPLTIEAMFAKVKWTPIKHYSTDEISNGEMK